MAIIIVGSSNAVNLTDGLDGLAIGCTVIAAGALTVLTYVSGHAVFADYLELSKMPQVSELTIFCGSMVGSAIGFLWYNAHPAEVFMGDVGSLALGGAIGTVAVIIKQELLLPFIGGVFVIEALSVILQVGSYKLRKKRIFKMAPHPSPLRVAGLERVEGDRALLDCLAGVCTLCSHHVEVAVSCRGSWHNDAFGELRDRMEVNGKRVLVVGLGKSGVASALFLASAGRAVTVSDAKSPSSFARRFPLLLDQGISVETGQHGERTFREQDLIVVSPGVPFDVPQLVQARELRHSGHRRNRTGVAVSEGQHRRHHRLERQDDHHHAGGRYHRRRRAQDAGRRQHRNPAITFVDRATDDTWIVLEDQQLPTGDDRDLSSADRGRAERHARPSRPPSTALRTMLPPRRASSRTRRATTSPF